MNEVTTEAIYRANKLGAQGYKIIGMSDNQGATSDGKIKFIIEKPIQRTTDKPWYY